jgi:hypothetical protein
MEDCLICQESWDEDDWVLSGTHCHHTFHRGYLMEWFYSDRENHNTCPYCREKCWPTQAERATAENAAWTPIDEPHETAKATWAVSRAIQGYPDTEELVRWLNQILNDRTREDPSKDAADLVEQYVGEIPSN